jgi:hypothetical protein
VSKVSAASPVSFEANVARLPHKGMPVVIEADAAQRAALAADHGLVSVESWRAELLVEPWKRNGVRVSGEVNADITQQCVVTLEPLQAKISEAVSGLYFPEDSKLGRLGFQQRGCLARRSGRPRRSGNARPLVRKAEFSEAQALKQPRVPGLIHYACVNCSCMALQNRYFRAASANPARPGKGETIPA